jgi:hypothetical protein
VPVAAAGLADLGVRHPCEAVRGRVCQALLAHAAHLLLLAAQLVEAVALGRGSGGERVPRAFQLGDRDQRRAASASSDRAVRPPEVRQLAVEPGDLVAQRPARGGLVCGWRARIGERDHLERHVSRLSVRSG